MRIARDGTWFYRGTPIARQRLVKLFASVLRREDDGSYWLVTPVERGRIVVEDAHFGPKGCQLSLIGVRLLEGGEDRSSSPVGFVENAIDGNPSLDPHCLNPDERGSCRIGRFGRGCGREENQKKRDLHEWVS